MAYTNANTSAGPSSAAPPGLLPLLGARGKELAALLIFLSTAVMVAYQLATRQKVPDADNHRPKSTSSASSRKKRASDTLKDGGKVRKIPLAFGFLSFPFPLRKHGSAMHVTFGLCTYVFAAHAAFPILFLSGWMGALGAFLWDSLSGRAK